MDINDTSLQGQYLCEVLLCDDSALSRRAISEHLKRFGISVIHAENGREGFEKAKDRIMDGNPFPLILMDINMPEMDGYEAAALLMESGNTAPVIALSGKDLKSGDEGLLKCGINGFLPKPFTERQLSACIEQHLNMRVRPLISPQNETTGGISLDTGIVRAAGNEELYEKLLTDFYHDNLDFGKRFNSALELGDGRTAHLLAHTLKGVAGLIGANMLCDKAKLVENALADIQESSAALYSGNYSKIDRRIVEDLLSALNEVLAEAAPIAAENRSKRREYNTRCDLALTPDKSAACEFILNLEELILDGDSECLSLSEDIARMLGAFKEASEHVIQLIELIQDYEFERALIKLEAIKPIIAYFPIASEPINP